MKTDPIFICGGECLHQTLGGVSPDGRIVVVRWRQNHHVVIWVLLHEVGHALTAHRRISSNTTTQSQHLLAEETFSYSIF